MVRDCPICCSRFTEVTNIPMVLTCGHSVCHCCVSKIQYPRKCPFCQKFFAATGLRKNYALIEDNPSDIEERKVPKLTMPRNHSLKTVKGRKLSLLENMKFAFITACEFVSSLVENNKDKKDLGVLLAENFDDELPNDHDATKELVDTFISETTFFRKLYPHDQDPYEGLTPRLIPNPN